MCDDTQDHRADDHHREELGVRQVAAEHDDGEHDARQSAWTEPSDEQLGARLESGARQRQIDGQHAQNGQAEHGIEQQGPAELADGLTDDGGADQVPDSQLRLFDTTELASALRAHRCGDQAAPLFRQDAEKLYEPVESKPYRPARAHPPSRVRAAARLRAVDRLRVIRALGRPPDMDIGLARPPVGGLSAGGCDQERAGPLTHVGEHLPDACRGFYTACYAASAWGSLSAKGKCARMASIQVSRRPWVSSLSLTSSKAKPTNLPSRSAKEFL